MRSAVRLKIAETVYAITSEHPGHLQWLEASYASFACDAPAQFAVALTFGRPADPADGRCLRVNAAPHFIVDIDFGGRQATVRARRTAGIVDILKSVVASVCIDQGGFLLHACSVAENKTARVFFGASGSGKTTIARLARGRTVLTDETTAVVVRGGKRSFYATPFNGDYGPAGVNAGYPAAGFFALEKDAAFGHRRISAAESVKRLFPCVFMPSADPYFTGRVLSALESAARDVPCYALRFARDEYIWRYLDESVTRCPQGGHCLAGR